MTDNQMFTGMVTFVGIALTGFLSFLGGRGTAQANIQAQINASFSILAASLKAEINDLRGELANERQYTDSLAALLRRNGIEVPQRPLSNTVFVLDGTQRHDH